MNRKGLPIFCIFINMIYLIDDNKSNQQEKYGCSFIKDGTYKNILTYLNGIPTPERADFLDELSLKANAVFFHSTSKDMDRNGTFLETAETINKIYAKVKKDSMRYVRFSWGHTSANASFDLNENIDLMNKRLFYLNLKEFLDDYLINGFWDFNILASGIAYKKELLIEHAQKLIAEISTLAGSELFNIETFYLSQSLEGYLVESKSSININEFASVYSEKITNSELIELIKKSIVSIRKYGTNIYY